MKRKHCTSGLIVLALMMIGIPCVSARLAVMSIDLGGEYMKIAIVKPGVPMEIVLNKESSRKTPTVVAFRDGERHFANQALNTAVKFPSKAFGYLTQIIGRQFDDPQVQLYKQRFPYHNMLKDEERGTVLFKLEDDTIYSPEELLGMILEKAREYAQEFAEQDIKDAVITVPSFYTQAERRAVVSAATMVGINVLQLISDNAAVALNYGVFRRKNFNSTMQYYMFYDMGSTSTTATIVGYNVVKTKEGTRSESNPQLTVKGIGFDRSLGGLEFTLRLRAHLAKVFNNQKKTTLKIEENNRAMAKLLKESERVKKVLSANVDHHAQVEGLLDEKDFRAEVTRADLEEMNKDLFQRVTKPIEEALKVSEITLPEISEIILMGGGTRMPKVQELLMKFLGRSELGKSINTDEAAALGAVYQAAYLGKGFKVKKFGVREGNIYPINVEFEKQKTEDQTEKSKVIKRTLFGRMNPFPQKKVMTFNKHTKDFSFSVMYSSLDFLTEEDRKSFGSLLISKYTLLGVEEALSKNKDKAEPKGIKAHFQMDGSGILSLDKVESVFEKNSTDDAEEKSTWSKLGSAIGGLFGGGAAEEEHKVEDSPETPDDPTNPNNAGDDDGATKTDSGSAKDSAGDKTTAGAGKDDSSAKDDQPEGEQAEKTDADGKKEAGEKEQADEEGKKKEEETKKEEDTKDSKADEKKEEEKTKQDGKKESGEKEKKADEKADETEKKEKEVKEKVPKVVNIKELIQTQAEVLDIKDLSEKQLQASIEKLAHLRKADVAKMELEKIKNELEAFIFDIQDKLSEEMYEKVSTEEEREKYRSALSAASDWLYEQGEEIEKSEFVSKLKSLKDMLKDMVVRVYEYQERPKALDALKNAINQTSVFLATIKNLTDLEDPIFTTVELDTLEKLIKDTLDWRDTSVKEQEQLKLYEMPKLLVEQIAQKIGALDREMKYLINKAKNFKPKAKPKEEKKTADDNSTKTDDNSTTTEKPEQSQEDTPPTEEPTVETDKSETKPDVEKENQDTETKTSDTTSSDAAGENKEDEAKPSEESHSEL